MLTCKLSRYCFLVLPCRSVVLYSEYVINGAVYEWVTNRCIIVVTLLSDRQVHPVFDKHLSDHLCAALWLSHCARVLFCVCPDSRNRITLHHRSYQGYIARWFAHIYHVYEVVFSRVRRRMSVSIEDSLLTYIHRYIWCYEIQTLLIFQAAWKIQPKGSHLICHRLFNVCDAGPTSNQHWLDAPCRGGAIMICEILSHVVSPSFPLCFVDVGSEVPPH